MSLIATARALDDARFLWRIRAALLKTASIRRASQLPEEIAYSHHILQNPMQPNPLLESLAAADIGVSEVTTVTEDNMVDTEEVKDETLMYIAEVNFGWMAAQFVAPVS